MDDCYNSIMKPKQSSNASVMQKEHNKTIDCTSFSWGVAVCVCAGMNKNREGDCDIVFCTEGLGVFCSYLHSWI